MHETLRERAAERERHVRAEAGMLIEPEGRQLGAGVAPAAMAVGIEGVGIGERRVLAVGFRHAETHEPAARDDEAVDGDGRADLAIDVLALRQPQRLDDGAAERIVTVVRRGRACGLDPIRYRAQHVHEPREAPADAVERGLEEDERDYR